MNSPTRPARVTRGGWKLTRNKERLGTSEHTRRWPLTRIFCVACLAVVTMVPVAASAPVWTKVIASDGAAGDQFGTSVAISGSAAIAGAPADGDAGLDSGSAYMFERVGGVWMEVAKLTASDAAAGDRFGTGVAISGNTAIVGAPGKDSRVAYVFKRVGGTWTEVAKLAPAVSGAQDQFGHSVAISGGVAIVGGYGHFGVGTSSGAAWVFEGNAGEWTEVAMLTASDETAAELFGFSVSISGNTAIVGAPHDDDAGDRSGSAYAFERVGGVWMETAKLTASDAGPIAFFGWSVAISGDAAIFGAFGVDDPVNDAGTAYVFERAAGVWMEVVRLTPPDTAELDQFGTRVAISGEVAVIASPSRFGPGFDAGSAYVLKRIGVSWVVVAKLTAADVAEGDRFGDGVGITDGAVIVGVPFDDDAGLDSGSVWLINQ